MKGALIGCGFFAQNHLNAWRDMRARGRRACRRLRYRSGQGKGRRRAFGVPRCYTDPAAMFAAEALDFVDIATRMDTHKDLVLTAIGKGIRTIVQKPFAPSFEDCVAMVEAAKAAGVPLAVHENFRFQTPMRIVAETLASGVIGTPSWARLAFRTGYDVYRTQPYFHQEKKLAILDVGIHVLDIARVFLGEVQHVSCEIAAAQCQEHRRGYSDDDDAPSSPAPSAWSNAPTRPSRCRIPFPRR